MPKAMHGPHDAFHFAHRTVQHHVSGLADQPATIRQLIGSPIMYLCKDLRYYSKGWAFYNFVLQYPRVVSDIVPADVDFQGTIP